MHWQGGEGGVTLLGCLDCCVPGSSQCLASGSLLHFLNRPAAFSEELLLSRGLQAGPGAHLSFALLALVVHAQPKCFSGSPALAGRLQVELGAQCEQVCLLFPSRLLA